MSSERDDQVGGFFDAADEIDECAAAKDWRQQQDDEREQRLEEALAEAKEKGVSTEALRVLCFEAGATRWALQQSLKG